MRKRGKIEDEERRYGGETRKGRIQARYGVASLSCSHGRELWREKFGRQRRELGLRGSMSVPPSGLPCHAAQPCVGSLGEAESMLVGFNLVRCSRSLVA